MSDDQTTTTNTTPTDQNDQVVTEEQERKDESNESQESEDSKEETTTNDSMTPSTEGGNDSSDSSDPSESTDAEASENAEPPMEEEATTQAEETTTEPEAETPGSEKAPAEDAAPVSDEAQRLEDTSSDDPNAKWYVVHTYSGHENKVATALKQRVESEHLEHKILDVIVPTQDKIEIRSGKKSTVKEKIFPGYILVKMVLDDGSWLAVRTTQGVTSFVGIGNKPTPIPEQEVKTIVKFMTQGAAPTFKDVYMVNDTVKITDGPFSEFIGKVDSVDKEHGKVRVLVSIFGRETPVELDFLQVQKL